jgi:hypothetical protein
LPQLNDAQRAVRAACGELRLRCGVVNILQMQPMKAKRHRFRNGVWRVVAANNRLDGNEPSPGDGAGGFRPPIFQRVTNAHRAPMSVAREPSSDDGAPNREAAGEEGVGAQRGFNAEERFTKGTRCTLGSGWRVSKWRWRWRADAVMIGGGGGGRERPTRIDAGVRFQVATRRGATAWGNHLGRAVLEVGFCRWDGDLV